MNYDELPRSSDSTRRKSRNPRRSPSLTRNCIHKKAYFTASLAERARERRLAAGTPFLPRIYRCLDCHSWHPSKPLMSEPNPDEQRRERGNCPKCGGFKTARST